MDEKTWFSCKNLIKKQDPKNAFFLANIDSIRLLRAEQSEKRAIFHLAVDNSSILKCLKKPETLSKIKKAISLAYVEPFSLEFKICPETVSKESKIDKKPEKKDISKNNFVYERYSFSRFIESDSNKIAFVSCKNIAFNPCKAQSLFIYGPSGTGKTHLLFAIKNHIKKHFRDLKVRYVTGESFVSSCVDSMLSKKMGLFKSKYRKNTDVFLVDDIQSLKGEASLNEFFHTLESLYQKKSSIVFVSDKAPEEIRHFEQRLLSRLRWGECIDILPPDFETKLAILKQRVSEEKRQIPLDVLNYLAEVSLDVRQLEGFFRNLILFIDVVHKGNCPRFSIVKSYFEAKTKRKIYIEDVFKAIEKHTKINKTFLISSKREKSFSEARQIFSYISYFYLKMNYKQIGDQLGKRSHSTIMNSLQRAKEQINSNVVFLEKFNKVKQSLQLK